MFLFSFLFDFLVIFSLCPADAVENCEKQNLETYHGQPEPEVARPTFTLWHAWYLLLLILTEPVLSVIVYRHTGEYSS